VIVGHESLATPDLRSTGAIVTREADGITGNLRTGLDTLPGARRILALSGDLPLLTPAALRDLFAHAPESDLVFPYVERADILRDFPDREWVFSESPDGWFTGCSLALFRPKPVMVNWRWAEQILNARRRSPLGLARMIGPAFAVRYLMRRLRVVDVERKLSALLQLDARGYQSHFSELAMDVDKGSDIALVESVLRQSEASLQRGR